ncbi:hypothetical protein N7450_001790 [Penicillium hetheringtonii]|uniref:Nudix hydrolase domain-containing protein n=1 Tax=Penicillium hetheringtonii TaxID=911720 RepID=A0AAD6H2P9_9EURO|nr:hypothetical protein N7450_001790 [Penicillium hetheringtonii]
METDYEILNIEAVEAHCQKNGFERVSGSTIIPGYRSDDLSMECPGGGAKLEDKTIPKTIVHETHEETGLKLQIASDCIYCVRFDYRGYRMAKYIAIATFCEEIQCQRLSSDKFQEPRGSDGMAIQLSDEYLVYLWATEEQIQNAVLYNPQATEESGLVMMESNRKILLDFFLWLKKHDLRMEYALPELDPQLINRI